MELYNKEINTMDDVAEFAMWLNSHQIVPHSFTGRLMHPFGKGLFFAKNPAAYGELFDDLEFINGDVLPLEGLNRIIAVDDMCKRCVEVAKSYGSVAAEVFHKVGALLYVMARVDANMLPPTPPEFFYSVRNFEEWPEDDGKEYMKEELMPMCVSETISLAYACGVEGIYSTGGCIHINSQELTEAGWGDFANMLGQSSMTERLGGHTLNLNDMSEEERQVALQAKLDEIEMSRDNEIDIDSDDYEDDAPRW